MSLFNPSAVEVENAVFNLRHKGQAAGTEFGYTGPYVRIRKDELDDYMRLAWHVIRNRPSTAEVPALVTPPDEDLVELVPVCDPTETPPEGL